MPTRNTTSITSKVSPVTAPGTSALRHEMDRKTSGSEKSNRHKRDDVPDQVHYVYQTILSTDELRTKGLERDEVARTCVRAGKPEPKVSYMNGRYGLEDQEFDQSCAIYDESTRCQPLRSFRLHATPLNRRWELSE